MDGKKNQEIDSQVISLLEEIREIHDGYLCTGQSFNLFDLFHAEGNEVRVCSVMRDLLDPKGSHGQGTIYLDLFLRMVLDMQIIPMNPVRIWQEFRIQDVLCTAQENRRIDLVIQAKNCFIAIEVKIYAGDQQSQCYDYFREVQQHKGQHQLYYLTLYGSRPSTDSLKTDKPGKDLLGQTEIESIYVISFKRHILQWLQACWAETKRRQVLPMVIVLEQFMEAIRGWMGEMDEETMELKDLLESNAETLQLAGKIEKALAEVKKGLLPRVMDKFEEKIKGNIDDFSSAKYSKSEIEVKNEDEDKIIKINLYSEGNNLEAFYNSPDTGDNVKRIGTYWWLKNAKRKITLCLGIEVQCNLYARVIAYEKGEQWYPLNEDDKENYIYLPLVPSYSEKTDLKHYRNMNEEMMDLFADDNLDTAITLNMERIKELLERVAGSIEIGEK